MGNEMGTLLAERVSPGALGSACPKEGRRQKQQRQPFPPHGTRSLKSSCATPVETSEERHGNVPAARRKMLSLTPKRRLLFPPPEHGTELLEQPDTNR